MAGREGRLMSRSGMIGVGWLEEVDIDNDDRL